jgi:aspartyl-tRNA synthetase
MLRSQTCGELRISDVNKEVTLCGWVARVRDKGGMIWVDLRDRYGLTQLILEEGKSSAEVLETARKLGREYVVKATGIVIERVAKNPKLPTGDVEVKIHSLQILNESKTPPFLIEDDTDGGDELRMKYRYLDLRRDSVRKNLELRHKVSKETRNYLDENLFMEVETPVLIKSTPEGARDFIVPSRMNPGQFYALPQSPQTFKQLLMVAGFDRYFQIVKCFRDEDLRADRQPEFTQIDCEMSFVEQEDILNMFEGLVRHLFKTVKNYDMPEVPRMLFADAMKYYGSDKPDTRFEMKFVELTDLVQHKDFQIFNEAQLVVGINAEGCAAYTRKEIDELTEYVKRPQVGAKGMIWIRYAADGTLKSSVDKFYSEEDLKKIAERFGAKPGDLMLVLSGAAKSVRGQLNDLRLELGNRLGLRPKDKFSALWVIDFPLLEFGEEEQRWFAMHHPFTSPKDIDTFMKLPFDQLGSVNANAYDLVINGVEVGGGSIRIYDRTVQNKMFEVLGFTEEEAKNQFGFLLEAFEYGAPPHAGLAFGFDRLCSIFGGADSIRDFIAFPKNNSGRDVMIDSPSVIEDKQLKELNIQVALQKAATLSGAVK